MYTLQYKVKGSQWTNHPDVQPSSDRQPLALIAIEMAKANPGTSTRVHTESTKS